LDVPEQVVIGRAGKGKPQRYRWYREDLQRRQRA
jgi:hypothetical protein